MVMYVDEVETKEKYKITWDKKINHNRYKLLLI